VNSDKENSPILLRIVIHQLLRINLNVRADILKGKALFFRVNVLRAVIVRVWLRLR
jgi:hypothetical protein